MFSNIAQTQAGNPPDVFRVLVFDGSSGVLDKLLSAVGLPAVSWQSGSGAAFSSVVLVTPWWRVGFNMLIYLAGPQGIGLEL